MILHSMQNFIISNNNANEWNGHFSIWLLQPSFEFRINHVNYYYMRWVSHSRIPILPYSHIYIQHLTFNIQHISRKQFIQIVKCIWNRIQWKRNCLIYFCIAWSSCSLFPWNIRNTNHELSVRLLMVLRCCESDFHK